MEPTQIITEKTWVSKSLCNQTHPIQYQMYPGDKIWLDQDGLLHRDGNLPAIEGKTQQLWFIHGKLHRLDGPAVIYRDPKHLKNTIEEWFMDGEWHRENGPAYIEKNGQTFYAEMWYHHGKRHRIGGPAYITWDGSRPGPGSYTYGWFVDGQLHREDGPALTEPSDYVLTLRKWYIRGKEVPPIC